MRHRERQRETQGKTERDTGKTERDGESETQGKTERDTGKDRERE